MAIEQERTEAAISERHCQTPTRLGLCARLAMAELTRFLMTRQRLSSQSVEERETREQRNEKGRFITML